MVLDEPEVVDAEPVGQLDLLQGVFQQAVFVIGRPGSWELVLVEDARPSTTTPSRLLAVRTAGSRSQRGLPAATLTGPVLVLLGQAR